MKEVLDVGGKLEEVEKVLDELLEAHYSGKLCEDDSELIIDWYWDYFGISIGSPDPN